MKKIFIFLTLIFAFVLSQTVSTFAQAATTDNGTWFSNLSLVAIISGLVIVYEAVVRIVPTVKNISLLNTVFGWLKNISETLNVKKK